MERRSPDSDAETLTRFANMSVNTAKLAKISNRGLTPLDLDDHVSFTAKGLNIKIGDHTNY
jgi:hypothetical protein